MKESSLLSEILRRLTSKEANQASSSTDPSLPLPLPSPSQPPPLLLIEATDSAVCQNIGLGQTVGNAGAVAIGDAADGAVDGADVAAAAATESDSGAGDTVERDCRSRPEIWIFRQKKRKEKKNK